MSQQMNFSENTNENVHFFETLSREEKNKCFERLTTKETAIFFEPTFRREIQKNTASFTENYAIGACFPNGIAYAEREYFRILNSIPAKCVTRFITSTPLTAFLTQKNESWKQIRSVIDKAVLKEPWSSVFLEKKFWDVIREYSETGRPNQRNSIFPSAPEKILKGDIALWRKVCRYVDEKNMWSDVIVPYEMVLSKGFVPHELIQRESVKANRHFIIYPVLTTPKLKLNIVESYRDIDEHTNPSINNLVGFFKHKGLYYLLTAEE